MRRITWQQTTGGQNIIVDFVKLNNHLTASFLIHFLRINNIRINQNPEHRPKENLLVSSKNFLASKNLKSLPTIFIKNNDIIYNIPVIISGVGKPTIEKQETSARPSDYAKLFHLIPEFITFSERNLIQLISNSNFPAYIDKQFCIDFLSKSLFPSLDRFFKYTPRTLERRNSISVSVPRLVTSPSLGAISVASNDSISSDDIEGQNNIAAENLSEIEKDNKQEPEVEPKTEISEVSKDTKNQKSESKTKMGEADKNVKILLDKWKSVDQSGCAIDWLRNSTFVIDLKNDALTDKTKISLILGAVENVELKCKLIDEFSKVESGEQTMEKFKSIFEQNTTQDLVTYRRYLKALKYSPDDSMHDLYQRIYRYVYKSMGLEPKNR